jgi:hypothetical protein
MRHSILLRRLCHQLLFLLLFEAAVISTAHAEPSKQMVPLASWPAAKIRALAPLLFGSDIAVFESRADGHLRQLSLFTWVAAPPAVVRDVILRAELYKDFVPNFKESNVTQNADGTFKFHYRLEYGFFSIEGDNRYITHKSLAKDDALVIEIHDLDNNYKTSIRRYIFELFDVSGGTVVAMYGYTDVSTAGGMIDKLLRRVPTIEQGLVLVVHSTLLLSMKKRAEKLVPPPAILPQSGYAPYDTLLQRGTVVLLRSQNSRLSEISMVSRSAAPSQQLVALLNRPQDFGSYIPSITKSYDSGRSDEMQRVELEQSLPLLSFRTVYGVRSIGNSIDMFGLSGDLRGGRLRWDVGSVPGFTQLILRTSQQYDRASLLIRQLYKLEPLMEYGINVGLQMVLLVGVQNKAEQLNKLPRSETPIPADNKIYQ